MCILSLVASAENHGMNASECIKLEDNSYSYRINIIALACGEAYKDGGFEFIFGGHQG